MSDEIKAATDAIEKIVDEVMVLHPELVEPGKKIAVGLKLIFMAFDQMDLDGIRMSRNMIVTAMDHVMGLHAAGRMMETGKTVGSA